MKNVDFSKIFIELNKLNERCFSVWAFYPGMLFMSTDRWWGDGGYRNMPHEGIDVCHFQDIDGRTHGLEEGMKVPAIIEGEIVRIERDYIGESVFVKNNFQDKNNRQLHTIYGHVVPYDGVHEGKELFVKEEFASIANTSGKKVEIAPHLHISFLWIPESFNSKELGWSAITTPGAVDFIDPMQVIDFRYVVLTKR